MTANIYEVQYGNRTPPRGKNNHEQQLYKEIYFLSFAVTMLYKRALKNDFATASKMINRSIDFNMNLLNSTFIAAFLILSTNFLWPMDAGSVLEQNIPHYDENSEKTLSFCGTRHWQSGALKQELLNTLKTVFNVDTFVETGTYFGNTAETAKNVFSEVHTIELSLDLFMQAQRKFLKSKNVFVYRGDSPVVLQEILPEISGRILFYLDGHYSGDDSARSDVNTPILKELSTIRAANKDQSIILINDMRLFQDSLYPENIRNTCLDGYPDLRAVVEAILAINPTYQICFLGDALLAYPQDTNISVTPLVRACAIQRLSISFPEFPESVLQTACDVIANATWQERYELIIYHDMFSNFELNSGYRSFSSMWYGLILLHDDYAETALEILKRAANHSPQRWCIDLALQKAKKQLGISDEVPIPLLYATLALNQKSFPFIAKQLDETEYSFYEDDQIFLTKFPFGSYSPTAVPEQGTFFINDIDDSIKNQLRSLTPWEKTIQLLIAKYIKPGTVALDIGSHIGTHTVTMSQCVGDSGTVFAFEPNKIIYRELCYNLAINNCKNVYPLRCAVGKSKSVIEVITSHPRNEGGSYVVELKGGQNAAVLLPLDALNLNNVSFIKVDVENMEADVLDGARETILRNRPVMLIEVQGNGERSYQLNENSSEMALISINKIERLGYRLHRVEYGCDYLAIPKEF